MATASPSTTHGAGTHYVYTSVFRFDKSPIARSGTLSGGQTVPVNLTVKDGLDQGMPKATVYLAFQAGQRRRIGTCGQHCKGKHPKLFLTDSSGVIQVTYTTPASQPNSSQDLIVAQDLRTSATEVNSTSYAFAANTPVFSVGDDTVVEGDQLPGVPATFTVTVSPTQSNPTTIQYVTLCGIGDKGCGEDFVQVNQPISVTIPAHASSASFVVKQWQQCCADGQRQTRRPGGSQCVEQPRLVIIESVVIVGRRQELELGAGPRALGRAVRVSSGRSVMRCGTCWPCHVPAPAFR